MRNAFADASPSHHDQGVGRLQDLPHSGRLPCCTSRLPWHLPVNAHSQGDGTSLSMSHQILSLAFAVAARMALKATQLSHAGQLLYRRNWEDFEIWNWRALNALRMVPRCSETSWAWPLRSAANRFPVHLPGIPCA